MVPNQLQKLRKDCKELEHYIHKVAKGGKTDLAYKLKKKQAFIEQHINELEIR